MEKLNSDILLEILTRLPKTNAGFKSVLQCRAVCQLWRSLLAGKPKEGTLFVNKPIFPGDIKFYYREESSEMVNLNCPKQNFYKMFTEINSIKTGCLSFSFVGTSNGLVCFKLSKFIYIYNPITGESIRFLNTGHLSDLVGFGYCQSANTYKVVKIGVNRKRNQRVQVYTLGDGSGWRDKPEIPYRFSGSGVLANGALHWLNKRSDGCDIVAFDLTDETFRSIPPPPFHSDSYDHGVLGSCGGNLYLCASHAKEGGGLMDIWVLDKKNMNTCHYFTWITVFSSKWGSAKLLSRTESEILIWQNGFLSCYDPITLEKVWYSSALLGIFYEAIPHMHSLVSLKDLGEEQVDCSVLPDSVK